MTTVGILLLVAVIVCAVVVFVRQAQGKSVFQPQSTRARVGYLFIAAVLIGLGLVLLLSP